MYKLIILATVANLIVFVSCTESCIKCKTNEKYSACVNGGGDARNCSQLGYDLPIVKISPEACIKGCICIDGYLRAGNGTCIKKEKCPTCRGDPNAVSGCGVFCQRCSNYGTCPLKCSDGCKKNSCECKPGYIYDENTEKCVCPGACTPTCKTNEVYSDCTNGGCDPRNCSQLGFNVPCVKKNPEDCIKGCICKPDYLRDKNGKCIPKSQCPSCGGDNNAESGCGGFCKQCKGDIPCPRICKPNSCDCKDGYVYDPNVKKCVLKKNCTPTCKTNEVYSDCTNGGCDPRNCSQLGFDVPCIKKNPEDCIKGCICKPNYLRDKNGNCIPKSECPSCGGDDNAKSGCGGFCNQCKGNIICPKICKINACDCKDDYVYDPNVKKCVLKKDCTKQCDTNKNEVYTGCINGYCGYRNCSELGGPIRCVDPPLNGCIGGCICANGYLRAADGTCVPKDDCPRTCKTNEVYSDCTNGGCDPRNCSQLGFDVPCVKKNPEDCIKGCICKPNYLRDKNSICIPKSECPSCGGDDNAKSGCGGFCNQCKGNIICPEICKINACDCKDGYVYDPNVKKCVLKKDCTKQCDTDKNEVYTACTNGYCGYRNCSELGGPMLCVDPPPNGCIGGCICADGYLRAADGTCVLKDDCPCGGDPNAKPGCGIFCSRCSNYNCSDGPPICNALCQPYGCECRDGYIYDDIAKKCVLPQNCTPICKKNEVASTCYNGFCGLQNCTQYGNPIPFCPKFDSTKCKPGCLCKSTYLRNAAGNCIPQNDCPEAKCKKSTST